MDEFLDSIQEEEWSKEEEEEEDIGSTSEDEEKYSFGLLDGIISMVLGSLFWPQNVSPKQYFGTLKKEHE